MVPAIISEWELDAQQGLFKLKMKFNAVQAKAEVPALVTNKVNAQIVNPFTRLWKVINTSQLLSHTFPKYLKLAFCPCISKIPKVSRDSHDSYSWFG
jgi:hypothetical protein